MKWLRSWRTVLHLLFCFCLFLIYYIIMLHLMFIFSCRKITKYICNGQIFWGKNVIWLSVIYIFWYKAPRSSISLYTVEVGLSYSWSCLALFEASFDKDNSLSMEACIYLINQHEFSASDYSYHTLHHSEQRLCSLLLFDFEIKGNIRIAAMVSLKKSWFNTYVDNVAVCCS